MRQAKTDIPRKGIVRPQSQFPHSCVCERFIYSHDLSAYSAARKYVDRSCEYINRSNVEIGTQVTQFLFWEYINGIFVAVYAYLGGGWMPGLEGKGAGELGPAAGGRGLVDTPPSLIT
jgi:hypothetical protein